MDRREVFNQIMELIDFDLKHLVAKVTDEKDYISRDHRIEGHKIAIADKILFWLDEYYEEKKKGGVSV